MKKITLLVFLLLSGYLTQAQQVKVYTEKDYARNPIWISMIKDTTVNFFDAEKAYKIYFQHHQKPGGEHDVIGEHAKEQKNPSKKARRELQEEDHMRMEVKKYEHWRQRVLPYVQSDGTILTSSQRLQIWKDHKNK